MTSKPTSPKVLSLGTTELINGIESKIYMIRDQRVMLSTDLAELYGVEHRSLVQAVTRNLDRFPSDFSFVITNQEFMNLKSQIVTSSWGGTRKPPTAFTEQGVAMLSGILRSAEAVAVNIQIMRTFVRLRHLLTANDDLKKKLDELESKYDKNFKMVFDAIHHLMDESANDKPYQSSKIGFTKSS
jgi:hypothetical protein